MNFDKKMLLALRLIYEDDSKIITPSAGSIYLKLLFINKNLLENKKSKTIYYHWVKVNFAHIMEKMKELDCHPFLDGKYCAIKRIWGGYNAHQISHYIYHLPKHWIL